ncbi:MAG: pilus assembly protein TadE, partial [Chloroflexota bacterium]|nr:pilus assembly protein TadE [Chloroflexota bacterium]
GGDGPEVRQAIDTSLRASGLDPATVSVAIEPAAVGWRQPIQVRLGSEARIAIPFLFSTTLPLRSTAVARGEVAR